MGNCAGTVDNPLTYPQSHVDKKREPACSAGSFGFDIWNKPVNISQQLCFDTRYTYGAATTNEAAVCKGRV
jgi:hypothetical protein